MRSTKCVSHTMQRGQQADILLVWSDEAGGGYKVALSQQIVTADEAQLAWEFQAGDSVRYTPEDGTELQPAVITAVTADQWSALIPFSPNSIVTYNTGISEQLAGSGFIYGICLDIEYSNLIHYCWLCCPHDVNHSRT